MEPFTKQFGSSKAIEVLFLEDVEVQKILGTHMLFASAAPLSVLYFKDFNRFVLRVNDWLYPLMKRIPIFSESGALSRTYLLPTVNGFSYRLIVNNASGPAFENFENILSHNTNLTQGDTPKLRERSPDDKMSRPAHHKDVATSITSAKPTSMITGLIKTGIEKVKHGVMGLAGTKNLTSTKKRVMMSDIKHKDFRGEAKSTFKTNFFDEETKMTQKFLELRKTNPNNMEVKELSVLKKITDSHAPSLFLVKEDVEEAIYKQHDLIEQRMYNDMPEVPQKGMMNRIKDSVTGIIHREAPKEEKLAQPEMGLVEHYQG